MALNYSKPSLRDTSLKGHFRFARNIWAKDITLKLSLETATQSPLTGRFGRLFSFNEMRCLRLSGVGHFMKRKARKEKTKNPYTVREHRNEIEINHSFPNVKIKVNFGLYRDRSFVPFRRCFRLWQRSCIYELKQSTSK
ncbi:hypothetical protein AVEN_224379-1 [Araneus ventricosus]|uniref:Uncharacterized protein n=1 Tax=Araneus ventricosus TaxID=182803 RepID=A0A4Y2HBB7_ARAVE|nr:hypothetical protein AVEN_224379-1 [Araneus ventricosus]